MSDIVLEVLEEVRKGFVSQLGSPTSGDPLHVSRAITKLGEAIAEHKRTSDLHKTIAETIRTEMRQEFEGRRDAALAAFEQAHDRLALTLSADERAAN